MNPLRFLPQSVFFRHVLTLVTGTTIAQAIPVLIAPVLSRLYTPQDFGVFALYASVTGILTVATTGSYQLAVILPESDEDAVNLVAAGALITIVVSCITAVSLLFGGIYLASLLNQPSLAWWLLYVPISLTAIGFYQILNYWSNRRKKYRRMASCRVFQAIVLGVTTVSVGAFVNGPTGLVLGLILSQLAAAGLIVAFVWYEDSPLFCAAISKDRIVDQAKRYIDFPKYSVPSDTINLIAGHAPVFLLTTFFGPVVVGLYALTQRVLAAPITVVATAIADVYKQRAGEEYRTQGNCQRIFTKTLKTSALVAVAPFALFYFVAPDLFAIAFGQEWRTAGVYAQIMTVLYFLRFIVSPLSRTLYVAEKQAYDLLWQIGLFCVITLSIVVGCSTGDVTYVLALFSGSYSLMYLIYLAMSYYFSTGRELTLLDVTEMITSRKRRLPS